jgi:protein-tyrosine phosphatase
MPITSASRPIGAPVRPRSSAGSISAICVPVSPSPADFESFDYVLAMDQDNYRILSSLCPAGMESKLRLFMEFAPDLGVRDVPDPYYGGQRGFDQVFDLVEAASQGLLEDLLQRHLR